MEADPLKQDSLNAFPASLLEIVRPIQRTNSILLLRIFATLFVSELLFGLILGIALLGFFPVTSTSADALLFTFVVVTKFILTAYVLVRVLLDWLSTTYFIHDGRLIRRRGVLNITETIFQLTSIDALSFHQSWLGRMWNFGDVRIELLVGKEKEVILLYAVTSPEVYEQLFTMYV